MVGSGFNVKISEAMTSFEDHIEKVAFENCHLLPVSSDLNCLLITSPNSLDPDQARQNVGPDLCPNSLTLCW